MKICDVCYGDKGIVTPSTHTIWHKDREGIYEQRVSLDTCRAHSNLFKGNTFETNKAIADNTKLAMNRR